MRPTKCVMRKLVVEGGLVQKRLYDIGWSDEKKRRGCNKEGTEKHRTNVRHGEKSETRSQQGWGNGSKGSRLRRKTGHGKKV